MNLAASRRLPQVLGYPVRIPQHDQHPYHIFQLSNVAGPCVSHKRLTQIQVHLDRRLGRSGMFADEEPRKWEDFRDASDHPELLRWGPPRAQCDAAQYNSGEPGLAATHGSCVGAHSVDREHWHSVGDRFVGQDYWFLHNPESGPFDIPVHAQCRI
jgi:hypothetical protein